MKQIIPNQVRGYQTAGARRRAIAMLRKAGRNYFVCYRDVRAPFALLYGNAAWIPAGGVYIDR